MLVIAVASTLAGCSDIDPVISDKPVPSEAVDMNNTPFVNGADNYAVYRIPAMVITQHDNILAFAEGRVDGREDGGNIDIVLRRSGDRGQTWQDLIVIYDDGTKTCHNPCPVYLPEQNRVVLVMNRGYGTSNILVTYSDNEGQTWSKPVDITSQVRPAGVSRFTQGPCHGIVKLNEPNKGRIVVAGYQMEPSDNQFHANSIYSDDNGQTWHFGGMVPTAMTNESTVCELSDGSLLLSTRMTGEDESWKYRGHSISKDGGITWSEIKLINQLPDPGCQGALHTYGYGTGTDGKNVLLFTNPAWQARRLHNTLRVSMDDGATWSKGVDYTEEVVGGYSDVGVFSDGEVAVLHEAGYLNGDGIKFRKFSFDSLK